jgi:small subunit ribosomal protein S16
MLVIRMQRTGRKNAATFRVVLQENSQAPKSKALEILGNYNPHLKERKDQVTVDADRVKHWLSHGAQPSNTVHNLLVELGVITADKKKSVAPKPKPKAEGEEEAPAEKPAEEKKEE